jgi:hypothetical protein
LTLEPLQALASASRLGRPEHDAEEALMTTAATRSGSEILEETLVALERGDSAALARLIHDDFTMDWPQSGERFHGRENALAAIAAAEVKPTLAGEPRIVGDGSVWTVHMPLQYGDDLIQYLGVFELDGDQVRRSTEVFGAPFPAQSGRARYAGG